jgi:hypothetical protein
MTQYTTELQLMGVKMIVNAGTHRCEDSITFSCEIGLEGPDEKQHAILYRFLRFGHGHGTMCVRVRKVDDEPSLC